MSNINDRATVDLFVNGEQAKQTMERLTKRADELNEAIRGALDAGNNKEAKKLQRELDKVTKELNRTESAAKGAGIVLNDLSNKSLHGLKNTLKYLQKELSMTRPNSEAWKRYAEQIDAVKVRIKELTEELEGGQSAWAKFKNWSVSAWPAIDLIKQGFDATVGSMREFVDAYASMDQEMANVQKFTGMTAEQVADLNEVFKQIDTRTSREGLNKLAQEAGRLGKKSKEDVLGFVRAADQINVALDDLGDGATLTLSKLTGEFGDEARYGTEQSLLKVGSVINELSQNCRASAPYLANFASRMGGVGAQAKMTIPQIMAFGAVLDSNGQAVEASATAVSQVIVRMMQEPAKYAKVAGLDVKKFSEMLKTDVNGALIMFLETLQKAGGMDVLSPMFKDMGENGARAIQALSTLATHIDDVKLQQLEANKAFREGTSITAEFNVQNTTVQAELEKAQKRFQELRVELGQKLAPLMKHVISSTGAMARAMSVLVSFAIEHKSLLATLAVAIGSYHAATFLATKAQLAWNLATTAGKNVVAAFKYAIGVCEVGMIALTHGTKAAGTAFTFLNSTMKLSPVGLFVSILATLAVTLKNVTSHADEFTSKMKDAVDTTSRYSKEMEKELTELDKIIGALEGATIGTKEYDKAKSELMNKYSAYLQDLITEEGQVYNLKEAYDRLSEAIRITNEERGIEEARKNVEDTYYNQMEDLQKRLTASLERYGADTREATKLAMQVATAMSANRKLPTNVAARLNELSDNWRLNSWLGRLGGSALAGEVSPAEIVNKMYEAKGIRQDALNEINLIRREQRPYGDIDEGMLQHMISYAEKATTEGGSVLKVTNALEGTAEFVTVTAKEATELLKTLKGELAYRSGTRSAESSDNPEPPSDNDVPDAPPTETDKERRKREAEERRAAAKARKEFKEALNSYKAQRMAADREVLEQYKAGDVDYEMLLVRRHENESCYYEQAAQLFESTFADQKDTYLQDDKDYQKLLQDREKADEKYEQTRRALRLETIRREQAEAERDEQHMHDVKQDPTLQDEIALQAKLYAIRRQALLDKQALYTEGSKEWNDTQLEIEQLAQNRELQEKKLYFAKVAELRKTYDKKSAVERYELEKALLDALLDAGYLSAEKYEKYLGALKQKTKQELPGKDREAWSTADQESYDAQATALRQALESQLLTQAQFNARMADLDDERRKKMFAGLKQSGGEWNALMVDVYTSFRHLFDGFDGTLEGTLANISDCVSAVSAVVGAGLQIATEFAKAESEIQLKAVEKRYDREIELAQGNSYKVARLEKKKEEETARIKNAATKKEYEMKVIQAIAETAQAGLNAYSSTVVIPVIGPTIAPAAMAVALAMGATQVALLKKQQAAAEAQGYSQGGFTRPGAVDEPAGIVHAGEWVASQKLLASPVARPMIEALDYAQRTNTIGSLRAEDVSHSIRANDSLVRMAESDSTSALIVAAVAQNAEAVAALTSRLQQPFVTVNTVTGDRGIKQAQDEYSRLMNNVTPKRNRK